jgi:HEAT repeat protein
MANAKRLVAFCLALIGLIGGGLVARAQPESAKVGEAEEKTLKAAGVATDNESLLNYLKLRSLKEADRASLEKLIQDLDSDNFKLREKASGALIARGKLALPFLKRAVKEGPLEVAMRAKKCIEKIETASAAEQPTIVARLLALRNTPGAIEVLLNYLPCVDDAAAEEDVLGSLAQLTVRGGKIDPLLIAALKDQHADRRAAAVYILGMYGSLAHRDLVRQLLADADPLVQARAAAGLIGKHLVQAQQDSLTTDVATVKAANVATDAGSLIQFLQKRTLSVETQKKLQALVKQLGDQAWSTREKASKALIAADVPAIPFLRAALDDGDLETQMRARKCIQAIKRNSSPMVPSAVARLLAQAGEPTLRKGEPPASKNDPRALKASTAIQVLLAYLPFADDETVEEEVINALTLLSVREAKMDAALLAALHDPLAARRGAAAVILGKVGTQEQIEPIRKLLKDSAPKVQFRAALGLIAAQDKSAVRVLIDLFHTAPDSWVWQVEEQLNRLAANNAPLVPPSESTADYRKKAHSAWSGWWQANEGKIDLAGLGLARDEATLGLFTIVEYDSFVGNRQGKVWECGRDGKPRWQVSNLFGAMDGQLLPNGHVLIAENSVQKISERDPTGKEVWTFQAPGPPIAVKRLANGNTFIAMYDRVMEITPDRKVVYLVMRAPQMFMYGAQRLKNGHVAAITAQGQIVVFDPVANRDIKTINLGQPNGWCGIDVLPNGRYLVSLMNFNQIREVDETGKVHWQVTYPGVFRAIRLPNGNTVACSMTTRKVAELDRNGVPVWEITCEGRPWNVHYR